ncbi:MAG: holo-ACP synthase [Candidatus Pelagibacter sp.]
MEIIGNGVDIVQNSRIKKLIKNQKFILRIFSKNEINESKKIKNKVNFFAKRFAAKEAFVKSIGLGFRKGINLKDIYVRNDKLGKPIIILSSKVKKILSKKFNTKNFNFYLSLSDEKDYSIAYVILNKK